MARSMGKECAMTIRTATVLAAMSALAHVAAVADDASIASSDAFTYAADTVSDPVASARAYASCAASRSPRRSCA